MKELSVIEMESIAGAYSWDFSSLGLALTSIVSNGVEAVASAVTLGSILASYGSSIGGTHGSDNGGIFGVGTIGMAVGGLWGLIAGGIIGAITGALLGWDDSMQLTMDGYKGLIDGTTGIF
ncbi:hypothetical protein [Klebsiella pneumoniae]|uniref:hypothetical protein n=1 Tax=Klebsiella pneumoniae TaxID=573 RepID=UPI0020CE5C65|nr:hypothetical protein [Klebsiella pneumoniae]MCQ0525546.1 hypothetical protein [Klebsiella pneumoniae]